MPQDMSLDGIEYYLPGDGLEELAKRQENVAMKYDTGKPRMDLLVPEADLLTARVFTFGAEKYGDYNWMKGFNHSRLTAALLRHITSFRLGEDLDPESGLPHLAHARCCLDMLIWHTINRKDLDDRPTLGGDNAT